MVATFFVAAGFVIVIVTLTNVEVPVETLAIEGATSNDVVVGHVLSAQGDWTDVVRATDRGLMRIRSDQVLGRQLCHLSGAQPSGKRPLFDVIVGQPYESPNPSCKGQVKAVQKAVKNVRLVPGSLP